MIKNHFLPERMRCIYNPCIGMMNIQTYTSNKAGKVYRCRQCRKRTSLKNGNTWLTSFNIDFNRILKGILAWLMDTPAQNTSTFISLDAKTYNKLKEHLLSLFEENKIAGPDVNGQVNKKANKMSTTDPFDASALRKKLLTNRTKLNAFYMILEQIQHKAINNL